jgi:spore coat protein H
MWSRVVLFIACFVFPVLGNTHDSVTIQFPEIKIYISKAKFANLKQEHSKKTIISKPIMLVDGDSAHVKEIHDRGNNSMKFERKSLSVELDKHITLKLDSGKIKLKKFNLISMSMDKNFWHNRWANLLLDSENLFPLFNTYCKLWINDVPQGIYLLIEKPVHYRSEIKSPYMLRRGLNHQISDEYFEKENVTEAKEYRKKYSSIYTYLKGKEHDSLYHELSKLIDLTIYMRWMAFNYLVMNGDYSDEVYLYIDPETRLFEVLPWDFDDILKPAPHEGWAARNKSLQDKKVYSLEETLDRSIAANPDLYARYETELKNFVIRNDSGKISQISKQVTEELNALSQDKDIAASSLFLDTQPFDFEAAKNDITLAMDLLLKRRNWILSEIK